MPNGLCLTFAHRYRKFIANFTCLTHDMSQLNKYCVRRIEMHVYENSNKNIIIDGTRSASAASFFFSSFHLFASASENWPLRLWTLQAIRRHTHTHTHNEMEYNNKKTQKNKKNEKYNSRAPNWAACNWMRTNDGSDGGGSIHEGANKWTTQIIIAWHSRTYLFPLSLFAVNAPQAIKSITITALNLWYWIKVTRPFAGSGSSDNATSSCRYFSFSHFVRLSFHIYNYLSAIEQQSNSTNRTDNKKVPAKQYFMSIFGWVGMCRWHGRKCVPSFLLYFPTH